jgi:hypothetical protein
MKKLFWDIGVGLVITGGMGMIVDCFIQRAPSVEFWVLLVAFSAGVIATLVSHYWGRIFSIVHVKPEVRQIRTCNYYEGLDGSGHFEGDKKVEVSVTLSPTKEVDISAIRLKVGREIFNDDTFAPRTIATAQTYILLFYVPKSLANYDKKAQIVVVVNNIKHYSKRFVVGFGEGNEQKDRPPKNSL